MDWRSRAKVGLSVAGSTDDWSPARGWCLALPRAPQCAHEPGIVPEVRQFGSACATTPSKNSKGGEVREAQQRDFAALADISSHLAFGQSPADRIGSRARMSEQSAKRSRRFAAEADDKRRLPVRQQQRPEFLHGEPDGGFPPLAGHVPPRRAAERNEVQGKRLAPIGSEPLHHEAELLTELEPPGPKFRDPLRPVAITVVVLAGVAAPLVRFGVVATGIEPDRPDAVREAGDVAVEQFDALAGVQLRARTAYAAAQFVEEGGIGEGRIHAVDYTMLVHRAGRPAAAFGLPLRRPWKESA